MSTSFNTNTRSKEDVSLRLKQHNIKRARDETYKLENESRKMEERLQELRMAMNREKEEREKQGGGFWSRGQTGNLNSYASDVLRKSSSSSSKGSGKKKVKVLKDTPLDKPDRPSQPGTMAFIAKQDPCITPRQKIKGYKCGQCEEKKAAVACQQCSEFYCPGCFAAFHLKGALKKHRSVPISATGPRQCMSPRPTPPASSREVHDTYYNDAPPENVRNSYVARVQERSRNSPEGASGSFDGPSLLDGPSLFDGNFDETESAASFQEALKAWRSGPESIPESSQNGHVESARSKNTPRVRIVRTPRVDQMDSGTETQKAPPVEIKFTSNISYADRLLLKKHRRTDLEKMVTPRISPPSTPTVGLSVAPTHSEPEVQMPFTPRNPATPRIESYPLSDNSRSESLPSEDGSDLSGGQRINFQSLYETAKLSTTQAVPPRRDEDNISIIELDTVVPNPRIEETSKFLVKEVTEVEAWAKDSQTHRTTGRLDTITDQRPPVVPVTENRMTSLSSQNSGALKNEDRPVSGTNSRMSESKFTTRQKSARSSQMEKENMSIDINSKKSHPRHSSAKSRPASAKSRPASGMSRAKSRQQKDSRPTSRARSRAGSRMDGGEGLLTKAPSDALRQIAQMSAEVKEERSVPLGELFMIGVVPVEQERTITPSQNKSKEDKIRVSNTLYQMAPRSWRPDSSMAELVPADDVVIEPVPDPFMEHIPTELDPIMADTSIMPSRSNKNDNSMFYPDVGQQSYEDIDGDDVHRAPSRSDTLLRDVTLPEFPREKSHRKLPDPPRSSSQVKSKTPKPPKQERSNTPRSSSRFSPKSPQPHGISPRPSTRTKTVTPMQNSHSISYLEDQQERPVSRAIVVDGEDLSAYDNIDEQKTRNREDEDTLDKLEWELASESGRVTADGQISRLSVQVDTEDDDSTSSSRSFSRMSQKDQGYDINSKLRDDELAEDDTDRELEIDTEEVKALH